MTISARNSASSLQSLLNQSPYASYAYSYPHKTAYRPLSPPISLFDAWKNERRDALFLYLHVPFCEMRCGFCNLFTTTGRSASWGEEYIAAIERHAERVHAALGSAGFARMAVGGGTPTILEPTQLHRLFDIAEKRFAINLSQTPISIETSPATATREKLQVLRERGVDRISIGVQSFVEDEVHGVGRAQKTQTVCGALEAIRGLDFQTLNIDLMYGLPGQTLQSWLATLHSALEFAPEEIYLYPLYVRPLTGIERIHRGESAANESDIRLECYRLGRAFLEERGYRQISMRMFQAASASVANGPIYCCQEDGMVGIGSGARSYTSALHYSSEYAVGASGVREIISGYLQRPNEAFDWIDYGFELDASEQRRRYLIQSLLQVEGLDLAAYRSRFESDVFDDIPQLDELEQFGLASKNSHQLFLTARGMEFSDVIGPWLCSSKVREQMETFALR